MTTKKKNPATPAPAADPYGMQPAEDTTRITLPERHEGTERVDVAAPAEDTIVNNGVSVVRATSPAEAAAQAKARADEQAVARAYAADPLTTAALAEVNPAQFIIDATHGEVSLVEALDLRIVARDPKTGTIVRGRVTTPNGNTRFDNSPVEVLTRAPQVEPTSDSDTSDS